MSEPQITFGIQSQTYSYGHSNVLVNFDGKERWLVTVWSAPDDGEMHCSQSYIVRLTKEENEALTKRLVAIGVKWEMWNLETIENPPRNYIPLEQWLTHLERT